MKRNYIRHIILCLCLLAGTNAFAYDAEIDGIFYSFSGDEAIVTYRDYSYNSYSGNVVIPQSVSYDGRTYRVTSIDLYAFQSCSEMTSVTLPEGLTSISDWAFKGCTGLTSISLPGTLAYIGNGAFSECSNIATVSFDPDGAPHVGQWVFSDMEWYKNQPDGLLYLGKVLLEYKGYSYTPTDIVIEDGTRSIADGAFLYCSNVKSIVIPNSVKYIGNDAFNQTGISSIVLPEGITEICDGTFTYCGSLTSITIPEGVKHIGDKAFYGCSMLESITFSDGLASVGKQAFYMTPWYNNLDDGLSYAGSVALKYKGTMPEGTAIDLKEGTKGIAADAFNGCSEMASITIPASVSSIGADAFMFCSGLTSISLPEGLTQIGERAFSNCSGITSATIPNGVTSLKSSVLYNCSSLTSVTIPNSVTSIGYYAFYNCSSLTAIDIPEGVTSIGSEAFYGCSNLASVTIPSTLKDRGGNVFSGCYIMESAFVNNSNFTNNFWGMTFVDRETDGLLIKNNSVVKCRSWVTTANIPEGVTGIGGSAFSYCTDLTSVTFPESLTDIGSNAFQRCIGLTSLSFPEGLTSIGYSAFSDCPGLTSVSFPETLTTLCGSAFENCTGLTSVTIPNSVTRIDSHAFAGCGNLTSVTIGSGVTSISDDSFQDCNTIKTLSLDMETIGPVFAEKRQLTTLTLGNHVKTLRNGAFEGCYLLNRVNVGDGLRSIYDSPFKGIGAKFYVKDKTLSLLALWNAGLEDNLYDAGTQAKIEPFKPVYDVTASSLKIVEGLPGMRETIKLSEKISLNDAEGIALSGLDPDTEYDVKYSASLQHFNETFTFERTGSVRTAELVLTTRQPRVISDGNVIVAAQSNLDDVEANVGFEWRRTDWSDDFDSRTGGAYLYEGMMEGYIRSINSNYLWRFRPYYTSNAGNTYYGEWKGMDPSDYSYFEPTVHTYTTINVTGNQAEVKGYAMRGTDNVTSQGFMYWIGASPASLRMKVGGVPSSAKTVLSSGNVMTATLEDLEYETTYCYVAFVTTSEGETFYGEVQTFSTSFDPDGIDGVKADAEATEVGRYDLSGRKLAGLQKGINIIRYSDGTARKVLVK